MFEAHCVARCTPKRVAQRNARRGTLRLTLQVTQMQRRVERCERASFGLQLRRICEGGSQLVKPGCARCVSQSHWTYRLDGPVQRFPEIFRALDVRRADVKTMHGNTMLFVVGFLWLTRGRDLSGVYGDPY
jgi:hypothetical protein